jgi:coenzyme F420 hydrogenase subunit beta
MIKSLKEVVKADLCLGCGICALNPNPDLKPVKMMYSKNRGQSIPNFSGQSKNSDLGFRVCPGRGYEIFTLAKSYNLGTLYESDLGFYENIFAITSNDNKFLKNASSSGVMSIIVSYLIENKIVDKAIVTKFEYTESGPKATVIITDKLEEILEAQGSKYCPVDLSKIINKIIVENSNFSYVYVGTPCQIAGLRAIQSKGINLGIKFFIGNFCGGFKNYNNLNRLLKINKVKPSDVTYFRFRGGGQPGSMIIQTNKKRVEIPYPNYVEMTGFSKLKRCHFCVDATAELADFSCGDAWLPKYIHTKIPTSIVLTRTKEATLIINTIAAKSLINIDEISKTDVIESQKGNISTKKNRQAGRMILYKRMGIKIPKITEGYNVQSISNLSFEMNVYLSHKIKWIFENLGLFYFFYYKNNILRKIMYRLFKDNYN